MTEKEMKSKITQAHTDGYNRGYAKREEEIGMLNSKVAELEQENARLKAELEENKDLPAIAYQQGAEWWKKKADQKLAQAKEIIRSLYSIIQGRIDYKNNIPLNDEMYRAEQFLKEIKEK